MTSLVAVQGDTPVTEVWRRYTHVSQWSDWAPQISTVAADHDVIRAGMTGVVHGPLVVRVPFRIEDVDHDALRWSWRVGLGAASVRMEHGVDPHRGGGRAWVRIHLPRLLTLPYEPLARCALRRLVS